MPITRTTLHSSIRRLRDRSLAVVQRRRETAGSRAGPNPFDEDEPFDYSRLWFGSQLVHRHINERTSGDPGVDWLSHGMRHLAPAVGEGSGRKPEGEYRCLVLGANDGHNSVRRLCEAGFAGEIVATDIAENAISRARELLAGYPNVTFDVSDLNVDRFDGPFDYIVAEGVLHHVANIGPCLRHLNDILEPDGVLIANEYEGPVRFQLPDRQVQWINAALGALPGGLLPRWTGDPDLPPDSGYRRRTRYVPPSEASVRATDPSEALCGPELKRLLPEVFRVISRRGFGGTLLSYVSEHFRFDRADSDPRVGRFVRVLIEIEDSLIDTGILDDDFVYYELGRRDS